MHPHPPRLAHSHYCAHSVYTAVGSLNVLTKGTICLAVANVRCHLAVLHQELVWLDSLRESCDFQSKQAKLFLPSRRLYAEVTLNGNIEPHDCPAVSQGSGIHLLHIIRSK